MSFNFVGMLQATSCLIFCFASLSIVSNARADDQTFTLKNDKGMTVTLTDYGARVTSIMVPDREGNMADVALGYNDIQTYRTAKDKPYFGCVAGRYANRIAAGKFSIDGQEYTLATNNAPNHLHGGEQGFDKVTWEVKPGKSGRSIKFNYVSKDAEEGYPGNLDVSVTYTLTKNNSLKIAYSATTDKPTIVNLTNHTYFNLAGEGAPSVLDHKLQILANQFTPIDATSIPLGQLADVADTPFDFRKPKTIGQDIDADNEQLKHGKGYDHNFVLSLEDEKRKQGKLAKAAVLFEPTSGRTMTVFTSEPGIQLYTGNFLDGTLTGKAGKIYNHRSALCLETQHFPDSPNQESFPSTLLKPGETYETTTVYRFSVRQE